MEQVVGAHVAARRRPRGRARSVAEPELLGRHHALGSRVGIGDRALAGIDEVGLDLDVGPIGDRAAGAGETDCHDHPLEVLVARAARLARGRCVGAAEIPLPDHVAVDMQGQVATRHIVRFRCHRATCNRASAVKSRGVVDELRIPRDARVPVQGKVSGGDPGCGARGIRRMGWDLGQRDLAVRQGPDLLHLLLGHLQHHLRLLQAQRVPPRRVEGLQRRHHPDDQKERGNKHLEDREAVLAAGGDSDLSESAAHAQSPTGALRSLAPSPTVSAPRPSSVGSLNWMPM